MNLPNFLKATLFATACYTSFSFCPKAEHTAFYSIAIACRLIEEIENISWGEPADADQSQDGRFSDLTKIMSQELGSPTSTNTIESNATEN